MTPQYINQAMSNRLAKDLNFEVMLVHLTKATKVEFKDPNISHLLLNKFFKGLLFKSHNKLDKSNKNQLRDIKSKDKITNLKQKYNKIKGKLQHQNGNPYNRQGN